MGSYVERYWVSDVSGMNKAERMGGVYRPYVPDMLEGFFCAQNHFFSKFFRRIARKS